MYLCLTNPHFVQAIKDVENNVTLAKRSKELRPTGVTGEYLWFPGKSPEGGLPTLAWGHKITPQEWERKIIYDIPFQNGLTDAQVDEILIHDLQKTENSVATDWDKFYGNTNGRPWRDLRDAYKAVLINLGFNAGRLVDRHGVWIWKTVAKGILANDDHMVVEGMVTSYKKPDGTRVRLTTRAKRIAEAMGLPVDILAKVE